MARTYRRDGRGRFSGGGGSGKVGKTVAARQADRKRKAASTMKAQMHERAAKSGMRGVIIQNLR
jgi:hypothetical protein